MTVPSYPLVNGRRYSFASIEITANGKTYLGMKEVSYTDTCEPGEIRGTGQQLLGRTAGDYACEASMTPYREEADDLIESLGDGWMLKVFDVVVNYSEEGAPMKTDRIVGCRIKSSENNHSQGTDGLENPLELHPMYILRNGIAPIPNLRK